MPGLRVIAGKAKGRRLRRVPGQGTRPIRDSVKESLFNIIGLDVRGAHFLDLFAGTGSVGIEALSRNAASCVFIDSSKQAVRTIHSNLDLTGLGAGAQVHLGNALEYLKGDPSQAFDYVYVAPPQYKQLWEDALTAIDAAPDWLHPDAWVIVQIDPSEYRTLSLEHLEEFDQRQYGTTRLVFYQLLEREA